MLKFWWSIGIVRTLIQRSKCSYWHPHENIYFWSSDVCSIVIKTIHNWNQSCYFTLCHIAYYILNIHYLVLLVMVLYSYIVCTTVVWHEKVVFCYQNCSDLLEKNCSTVWDNKFEIQGWRSRICKFSEISRTIYSNTKIFGNRMFF